MDRRELLMADYQVVDREQLDADMTDVADHIRAKAEISTPLSWPDGYKAAVDAIQTGVELPELTNPGAASDLLAGKELIGADGEVVVGTVPERDSDDLIVSNNGIVVPAGHYTKQASAVLDSVELATPSIEVSDNGLITARVVQPSGYVSFSAKSQTKQLPTQGATTITPTDTPQKAVEAGTYVTGDIVVDAAEGGVAPPDSLVLDPDVVYATTRPKDWLPMPTPEDDEIYILCHVHDGLTATFLANISASGETTVEFGAIIEGAFVARETLTSSSGGKVEKMLDSASYGDPTSDGKKQCMVRIKGPVTVFNGAAGSGPHPGVEVVCGIKLTQIRFGYAAATDRCWMNLRYVSFVGNGGAANLEQAFYWCAALKCIRCEADNQVTNIKNSLRECCGLVSVSPKLITSMTAVDASYFAQRLGTAIFPRFAVKVSSLYYAFHYAPLDDINFDTIDTSACTNMNSSFRYGYAIRSIRNLDITSLSDTANMFSNLHNLQQLTFAGETTPGGFTIGVPAPGLTRPALLETINSLPVATEAATLTITDCAGASQLTDEDIAIATAKNWTITI
jgi:hypothetical protein